MTMADVICLAIHLYSLVGKQCTSGISEDMRFQVITYMIAIELWNCTVNTVCIMVDVTCQVVCT